jgi:hypothetical protein
VVTISSQILLNAQVDGKGSNETCHNSHILRNYLLLRAPKQKPRVPPPALWYKSIVDEHSIILFLSKCEISGKRNNTCIA